MSDSESRYDEILEKISILAEEAEQLAGAKALEVAQREMARALPVIIQLLNNPNFVEKARQEGYEFDAVAIFKAFVEASGWKSKVAVVRPINKE